MNEPYLTTEDHRIYNTWMRQAAVHARTTLHRRRVDKAGAVVEDMAERCPDAYVAWSGGKDSTALMHLASSRGVRRAMSEKDDLDFPGEEEYVRNLAAAWDVEVDILRPPFSIETWLREHAADIDPTEDMHGRTADLSRQAFYGPIETYSADRGRPGVYLGLRAEESRGRTMNRATRGALYQKNSGEMICTPLADWLGIDVYAYLASRGIEPLSVYRCVRMHESPDRVRKSWWLPGSHTRHGGMRWLSTYYPSLFRRLCDIWPQAQAFR